MFVLVKFDLWVNMGSFLHSCLFSLLKLVCLSKSDNFGNRKRVNLCHKSAKLN